MKKPILLSTALFLLVCITGQAQERTHTQATANGTPTNLKVANPEYKETPANGTPTWERTKNPNYQENVVLPGKKEEVPSAERKKNPELE